LKKKKKKRLFKNALFPPQLFRANFLLLADNSQNGEQTPSAETDTIFAGIPQMLCSSICTPPQPSSAQNP